MTSVPDSTDVILARLVVFSFVCFVVNKKVCLFWPIDPGKVSRLLNALGRFLAFILTFIPGKVH